jgi:hypothetical protein
VTALPRPRRLAAAAIVAFAALELGYVIWAAFVAHGRFGDGIGFGPDSAEYIAAARAPVWSRRFLAGPGGFGFLLVAKVCARNLRAIAFVQTALAVGAWSFLATTVSGVLRSNVAKWVGLVGILGLGLAPGVLLWNAMIATESLSIATLCVVIACGLRLVQRGTARELAWFVAAMAAFAFTRDTNALVVAAVGAVALAFTARRQLRLRALVVAVAGISVAVGALALSNAAEPPRWVWPLADTTAIRLLADPGATHYLIDHGFPWDEQMRTLPQRYIYIYTPVRTGASFAAFRTWVRNDGRRVYLHYLLSHPGWALRKPFDDRDQVLDVGGAAVYGRIYGNRPPGVFSAIGAVAGPRSPALAERWAGASAVALALLVIRRRVRPALAGAAGLVLGLSVLAYYAAWYGCALEVIRHSLTAAVQLRLACWIMTALVVDAIAGARASEVGVPQDADLDREEHESAPRDEPAGAVADPGA